MQGVPDEEVHRRHQRVVLGEFYRKSTKTLDSIVGEISEAVRSSFSNGRRLDGNGLKALFASVDSLVEDGMVSVAAWKAERPPTRARPKGEAYEAMYVITAWEESDAAMRNMTFRLHSIRIFGTRKKVFLAARPLPLQFSRHAAARFYDRATRPHEAAAVLGTYVHEWSLVPALAEDQLADAGAFKVAVPGPSGGLLLGTIDPTAAVPEGITVTFDRNGWRTEDVPASPMAPCLFTINTYVSGANLRPRQEEYRRCLLMWRKACGEAYEAEVRRLTWPCVEIAPEEAALDDSVVEALGMLVAHPSALRACGNTPSFEEAPVPARSYSSANSNSSQNFSHSA